MLSAVPTRRAVLRDLGACAVGVGALAALPGCTSGPRAPDPASPRREPDPDIAVVARALTASVELARRYAATAAALPELSGVLGPLAGEHAAHIDALGGAPTPVPTAPRPAPSSPAPPMGPTEALAALAAAERASAAARVADLLPASPAVARLVASIAACQATHAMILGSPG
jgi:hypothetical protein